MFGEFQLLTNSPEEELRRWINEWNGGDAVDNIISTRWMANCPWGYKWNLKLFYQHFWLLPAEQSGVKSSGRDGWQSLTLMDAHWQSRHSGALIICTKVMNSHTAHSTMAIAICSMEMINFRVPPCLPATRNEFRAAFALAVPMLIIIAWTQARSWDVGQDFNQSR